MVKLFNLVADAAKRIPLEQLPGYAPELNPIEWVESYLKKVADLANLACDNLAGLDAHLAKAKKSLQRKMSSLRRLFWMPVIKFWILCKRQ